MSSDGPSVPDTTGSNVTLTGGQRLGVKDVRRAFWRWFFGAQVAWNYETMQSGGVVLSLGPALRKIHGDDAVFRRSLDDHFAFFNTNPWTGTIALGAALAVEEQYDPEDPEASRTAVSSTKAALMGPLAGIGDAALLAIPSTILGALAAYLALDGIWLGILFPIAYAFSMVFVRRWMYTMGYLQGARFVTGVADQMRALAEAASALGLMVVGAMVASLIRVNVPLVLRQGEAEAPLQPILDRILPNLIPVALTALVYWLLGRKRVNTVWAIILVILIAFAGFGSGLFGPP
jgi:PTS system mannose-specific IID component